MDFKIVNDVNKYTLRLAKKNGKPKLDLPKLLLENSIKTSMIERVSIILDETHILKGGKILALMVKDETLKNTKKSKKCCTICNIY